MECFARATALAVVLTVALTSAPGRAAGTSDSGPADPGAEVVLRALSLLGVNYRFGGNTPESGLDCSGLVRLVYHDSFGMLLPRRSEEISRVGGSIRTSDLQPGDLVFFNTLRRAFSHVGIYIGNNQFVHAPSTGGSIRVESLDRDYWTRRFDGARRLLATDTAPGTGALALAALQPSARTGATRAGREPVRPAPRPGSGSRIAPPKPAERVLVRVAESDTYLH